MRSVVIYNGKRPAPPVVDPTPTPEPPVFDKDVAISFDPSTGFLDDANGTHMFPYVDPSTWNDSRRPSSIEARAIEPAAYNPDADPASLPAVANGFATPVQPGSVAVTVPGLAPATDYGFILLAHFEV